MATNTIIQGVYDQVQRRNTGEVEFLQAVKEVLDSLGPVLDKHPEYIEARILDRIVEPERQIMFRVPWQDDKGNVHVNRGLRFEFNGAWPIQGWPEIPSNSQCEHPEVSRIRAGIQELAYDSADGRRQGRI